MASSYQDRLKARRGVKVTKQKRVVRLKRMLTSLIENLVLTEMVMEKTLLTIRGALPKEEPKVHLPTVKAD